MDLTNKVILDIRQYDLIMGDKREAITDRAKLEFEILHFFCDHCIWSKTNGQIEAKFAVSEDLREMYPNLAREMFRRIGKIEWVDQI